MGHPGGEVPKGSEFFRLQNLKMGPLEFERLLGDPLFELVIPALDLGQQSFPFGHEFLVA